MAEGAGISEADQAAIKDMFKASTDALVAGNLDEWATYWTDDGVLMPPGHPSVTGRAELVDYVRGNLSNLDEYTQSNWTIEGSGDLAVVTTDLLWTFKSGDGSDKPTTEKGKQIVVTQKGADGMWKAQKVIYNNDGSP